MGEEIFGNDYSLQTKSENIIDQSQLGKDINLVASDYVHNLKYHLIGILLEFFIVLLVIVSSLLFELVERGVLLQNNVLNFDLIKVVIERSIYVTCVMVFMYSTLRTGKFFLQLIIFRLKTANTNSGLPILSIANNIFFIVAGILVTLPIRPVLQSVYLGEAKPEFSQAFVRFDSLPSIYVLLFPTMVLLVLIIRYKYGWERLVHVGIVIAVLALVTIFNSLPNFDARVYESRASWITKNWNKQKVDAEKALEEATTDQEKAYSFYWMGVAENRKNNPNKAIEYQKKAIELLPDYAAAHASLANGYLRINKLDSALVHANKCVEYDPKYAWCYQALSNYYLVTGDLTMAISYVKTAVDLDPKSDELENMLQYLQRQEIR